jgi:hypothetical protein
VAVIDLLSEFKAFDPKRALNWTLPMAAAWFIWRDFEAVHDQWKLATRRWTPVSDPPLFLLEAEGFTRGTLKSIFTEAGFDKGPRWDNPKTGPFAEEIGDVETESPWERLKYALQSGKLTATSVTSRPRSRSLERVRQYKDDWGLIEHEPRYRARIAPQEPQQFRCWTRSTHELILLSREQTIEASAPYRR